MFTLSSGVRPEEHPAASLRRAERTHGHEHHIQREEGDPLDRPAHQLRTGMSKPRAGKATTYGTDQTQNTAITRVNSTSKSGVM